MANTKTYDIIVNARTANANRALGLLGKNARIATTAIAGITTALGVKEYIQAANAFQQQANKLRIVTDSAENLAAVQGSLLRLSNETRSSLEATTTLYARLAQFSDGLGLSQQQLLNITGNVNKALAVSGATTQETASVVTQLSQAFASGALRGDEFRSISESGAAIMPILAREMGVTVGELKQLGSEGKITSEVLARALGGEIEDLNAKFEAMNVTLPQASQNVSDAFGFLVGVIDQNVGVTDSLASGMQYLSEVIIALIGLIDEDYLATVQQTAAKEALARANDELTKKYADQAQSLERKLQLAEADSAITRGMIKANHDLFDGEKLVNEMVKDGFKTTQEGIALKQRLLEVYQQETAALKRKADLELVSMRASLQVSEAERTRMSNAIAYQETLDEIAALRATNDEKEMLRTEALNKLKADQHQAELQRLQEVIDMEQRKRDEAILTEQVKQMQMGKTAEQARTFAEFQMKTDEEKAQFAIGQAKDAFQALGQYNKTAFAAYKAFAIGQAVMNTYTGATKALASYPPPFNFIAAAAVVASGLAQVAQIRSQQYSGRQFGGPVTGGGSYIVGERGPELFTPQGNGSITPNNQLGMGGGANITFNIDATDAEGFDDLILQRKQLIVGMVQEAMNRQGSSL